MTVGAWETDARGEGPQTGQAVPDIATKQVFGNTVHGWAIADLGWSGPFS